MSDLENRLEQIKTALAELRASTSTDGPTTRKQLDSLFRQVHSLKAVAAADGLTDLSRAAHEIETVLNSLRTGESTPDDRVLQQLSEMLPSDLVPHDIWNSLKAHEKHALQQSIREGANISVLNASFDVTNFEQEFRKLKERLDSEGEVISVAPRVASEHPEKIEFRILYAGTASSGVTVMQRALRAGQIAAGALGKEIEFELIGADLLIDDQSVWQVVADPLLHLVRNAVDHGIEQRGQIKIAAEKFLDHLKISVTDNGRGIASHNIDRLFDPGFSTASEVSELSGRGVGLDVVKTTIEQRGGSVTIQSEPGKGSTFLITLPL